MITITLLKTKELRMLQELVNESSGRYSPMREIGITHDGHAFFTNGFFYVMIQNACKLEGLEKSFILINFHKKPMYKKHPTFDVVDKKGNETTLYKGGSHHVAFNYDEKKDDIDPRIFLKPFKRLELTKFSNLNVLPLPLLKYLQEKEDHAPVWLCDDQCDRMLLAHDIEGLTVIAQSCTHGKYTLIENKSIKAFSLFTGVTPEIESTATEKETKYLQYITTNKMTIEEFSEYAGLRFLHAYSIAKILLQNGLIHMEYGNIWKD